MSIDFGIWRDLSVIERNFKRLAQLDDGFGLDIETGYHGPPRPKFSLHPETAFIAGISFSGDKRWARYIPLNHVRADNVDNRAIALLIAPLLASGRAIAHNAPFELRHLSKFLRTHLTVEELASFGLSLDGFFPVFSDSGVEAYLLGRFQKFGLKELVLLVFGHQMTKITDLFPPMTEKQAKCLRFSELELTAPVVSYACEDAAYALGLSQQHRPLVVDRLLYKVEMGLVPIIAEMEDYGVAMDWASMAKAERQTEEFAAKLRADIMRVLSRELDRPVDINLNSSPQVANVLYGELGLKTTRRTDGGKMSTDEKALTGLAKKHHIVRKIVHHRELLKLNSSYLTKYQRDFNYAEDGRTHSSMNQMGGGVGGRFSVADPGNQQFPKEYEYVLETGERFYLNFRDLVIAGPGHYLMFFDYSQIELRVLAALSGEPALIRAYQNGDDVHALTASLLFNITVEMVTAKQRQNGKTFNFSQVYQQGVKALAEVLGVTIDEAQAQQDRFFAQYPSVRSWVERQTRIGIENGYTTSVFGRRHPIWELESADRRVRSTGERKCVNSPVQGNAADICKIAMVRADRALAKHGLKNRVHMIMNVHDALGFEVDLSVSPQTVIDVLQPEVTFEVPLPGWPPLVVDWEVGRRLGSMVKLRLDENNQIIIPHREPAAASA